MLSIGDIVYYQNEKLKIKGIIESKNELLYEVTNAERKTCSRFLPEEKLIVEK